MKKIIMLMFLLAGAMMLLPLAWSAGGPVQLAPGVYTYANVQNASPANSFGANAGFVIGNDGVLVIDTLASAREGKRLLADIRKVTDKPIRYVVNTHGHLDHTFGNCVFAAEGAVLVAHRDCRHFLASQGQATLDHAERYGLTAEDMIGTSIALPTVTFDRSLSLDLGGITVELTHPAPSHTPGSILVRLPAEKILFAGDTLFTDFHPYLVDADLDGWQQTLDEIIAMDVETIVPGHGPLSTKADIRAMKDYLAMFDRLAQRLSAESDDPDEIAAAMLKVLPSRGQLDSLVRTNIESRYLSTQEK